MPKPVLKEREKEALLMVRKMLAGGVISHLPMRHTFIGGSSSVSKQFLRPFFNMSNITVETTCGTAHCIGGWMGTLLEDATMQIMHDKRFKGLFYPNTDVRRKHPRVKFGNRSWDSITPREAVQAIDSFLKTGKPNWSRQISPDG